MRTFHNTIVSMGVCLATVQCSSTPPATPVPVMMPPTAVVTAPVIDLSAVPVPDTLVATLRSPSVRRLAQRLGIELGVGESLATTLNSALPALFGGDDAMAHVINVDGPSDMAIFRQGTTDPSNVVSFDTLPFARAAAALSDGHTLTESSDHLRRVESTGNVHSSGIECYLAPAALPDGAGRLVCGVHAAEVPPLAPFLTRNLPRTALDANGPDMVGEFAVENLRRSFMADARSAADHFVTSVTPAPDPNNPAYVESVNGWARDLASSYPLALTDLASARVTLELPPTGITLTSDIGLTGTSAPLVRRWLDATHGQHPSADLFAHLPPDAYGYFAASVGLEPYRAALNIAASAVAANMVPRTHLVPADNTALRTAIAALFAQDHAAIAVAAGADAQGRSWVAAGIQVSTPPAQFVSNVRALLTAVKRPGVSRAISADTHEDVAHWAIVAPGPGIPAGSILLRVPPSVAARTAAAVAHPAPATAHPPHPAELLIVPAGAIVWVYAAEDARAVFRSAQAAHPAPVSPEVLSADGVAAVVAVVPGHIQSLFRDNTAMVQVIDRVTHDAPDHGLTPALLVSTTTAAGAGASFGLRLTIPTTALRIAHRAFSP